MVVLVSLILKTKLFIVFISADIALHNIYKCAEVMSLDVAINTALEENLFSNFPAIFNVKESYLSCASTNAADGIFTVLS